MEKYPNYGSLNQVCVIGHGTIGRGLVPLIRRHFNVEKITIIDPHPVYLPDQHENTEFLQIEVTRSNHREILDQIFTKDKGFCVNVSIDVCSKMIMKFCQERGILYIDSSNQEQNEFYHQEAPPSQKCSYTLRQNLNEEMQKLALSTTCITCCGANPGLVCWFVKQALLNIAKDTNYQVVKQPESRIQWVELMKNLGIKGIHVAERDTQITNEVRPPGEFWNTWSVEGFLAEGLGQPCEVGWGTHEGQMPFDARNHQKGSKCSIYTDRSGWNVMGKTWCPTYGEHQGMVISHDECIEMADYFTLKENDTVVYRPTVAFVYRACPDAFDSALQCLETKTKLDKWVTKVEEVCDGIDELGVLLYGHDKNAYWYGSQLSVHDAKKSGPYQNATSLQVCSGLLAGMAWAIQNPQKGFVECCEMDFKRCLDIIEPYTAPIKGYYTDWHPLKKIDHKEGDQNDLVDDPWQFKNIEITK